MSRVVKAPTIKGRLRVNNFTEQDDVTSDNLLNVSTPKSCANLHLKGGKITTGLGVTVAKIKDEVSEFELPPLPEQRVMQIFVYYNFNRQIKKEQNYLIIRTNSGNFYKLLIVKNSNWEKITGLSTKKHTEGVNYRFNNKDVMLFSSSDMKLTMYDGTTVTAIENAPKVKSMAVHFGRVFISTIDEGDLWFSDDYNPLNWNVSLGEAGFISFCDTLGKTIKVVSFKDYLYIFKEYGIYRLQAIGVESNFDLNLVCELSVKIYKDSIVQMENEIMFIASDGLYKFNGFTLQKINKNLKMLQNVEEKGIVSGKMKNTYLVALCNPDFVDLVGDNNVNNCLLSYDILTNKLEVSAGYTIRNLTPIKMHQTANCFVLIEYFLCSSIGMLEYTGKLLNSNLGGWFYTIKYGFGDFDKYKYIRQIKIMSKFDVDVGVETSTGTRWYKLKGSDSVSTIKMDIKTKFVSLIFNFESDVDIAEFEIVYERVK